MNVKIIPKVTVIIPVYKVDYYLDACMDSVLSQSYSNYQLIMTDDGSPTSDSLVCDRVACEDPRGIVIHKKNGGLSSARNVGIDLAATKFLSFVDSDDYIDRDFLSIMIGAMEQYNCDLSVCNITTVDDQGTVNENYHRPYNSLHIADGKDKYVSLVEPSAWNKIYSRDLFEKIRYPEGRLYEDLFIYHYLLDKARKEVYVGKNLYYYRLRDGSIMRSKYSISSTDIIDGYYDRAIFYDNKGERKLADDAYLWVYSRIAIAFSHLPKESKENITRLNEIKKLYNSKFIRMMRGKSFNIKQKIRFVILWISPTIHELLYTTANLQN